MSDTALNKVIQYGTTAERTAFTPDPAVGSQVLYIWYDTDSTPDTYIWDGSAWVLINPAGGGGDVVGPASAINKALARYDGITGKLLSESPVIGEDDGRLSGVTDPTGLQDAATKNYVDVAIANLNVGGASQNSFLVSGGQIVWLSDYDFLISAATYYINGVLFSSAETPITLDPADGSDDRIDVIIVDDAGTVDFVTGTPAAQPSEPDIDPGTQLKLGIVFVPASSTEPVVNTELLYFENAGGPTEWNWTNSGASINVNSASNPKAPATKDIEGTTVTAGHYAQGQIPSGTYDPFNARLLILYIRSKATWANNRGLTISLRNAGVLVGQNVIINKTGSFGFDSSVTGVYQLVAIPITQFAIPVGQLIDQIRITVFGNGFGFYIGDISFQEEGASQLPVGITQEQADALYVSKSATLLTSTNQTAELPNSRELLAGTGVTFDDTTPGERTINASAAGQIYKITFVIDGGGSPITTGPTAPASIPVTGTIVRVRLLADQAGDAVVDIWNDDFASYPPTDADSITGGNEPELTADISFEDTTLTSWSPNVVAGDVMIANVDSVDGVIERLTIEVFIQP